ncbi:MAG TPA: glycosyltransferase family 2 protein [Chloroflexia bacterium]|nr:glycosyltransferase family 2 protein [Chloroflexia bacterium]
MKLIVQIPCHNEEQALPITIPTIPRQVPGVDVVEILIIDDGSQDRTVEVARALGVDHVVRHTTNQGLAAAFQTGLDACLRLGADVIVNTDADNQYPQDRIPDLIAPILRHEADMVIGDRQVQAIQHFSPLKKFLQGLGSRVVRGVSGTNVPDAPSGFRAFSREAALRLNVITRYTYTLETIIQAGKKNLAVGHVPIHTNPDLRKSRLVRSVPDYVKKSGATIVRIWILYEPLKVFSYIAGVFLFIGVWGVFWLTVHWALEEGFNFRATFTGHLPTTFATVLALVFGIQIFLIGLVADILAANRRLTEDTLYRVKRTELELAELRQRGQALVSTLQEHGLDGVAPTPATLDTTLDEPTAAHP